MEFESDILRGVQMQPNRDLTEWIMDVLGSNYEVQELWG